MSAAVAAAVTPKNGSTPHLPPPSTTPPKFVASQLIDISLVEADPHNPRKDFPKEEMNELINSIMLFGVRQPIEVRAVGLNGKPTDGAGLTSRRYRIVFGERRYRAAKAAGLKEIPAIVRTLTDIEAAEVQLDENLKRAELSPLEVAGGYQRQLELGRTMEQVCQRAGKKRTQVYATLQLLQLGPEARKSLGEQKISASVAMLVARVPKALQPQALALVEGSNDVPPLTYREAEDALSNAFTVDLKKAPFDTKDAKLCPAAGSCTDCKKRSGNATELFPDIKSPDVCTDTACFREKTFADAKRLADAKGLTLLDPAKVPPEELFWNGGTGPLRDEAGYIEPKAACLDDAQSRSYEELLKPEQLKKLLRLALDGNGQVRKLLERTGLQREVRRAGLLKERRKLPAPTPKEKAALKDKAAEHAVQVAAPSLDELIDNALVAECVAAAEKRGPTPAMLKLLVRELIGQGMAMDLFQRRGIKDPGAGRPDEKEFNATFGPLPTSVLFGVLVECVLGPRYTNGDGFEDVADELGVDVKKVKAKVEAQIRWTVASKRMVLPGVEIEKGKPVYVDPGHEIGIGKRTMYVLGKHPSGTGGGLGIVNEKKNGILWTPRFPSLDAARAAADEFERLGRYTHPAGSAAAKLLKTDPLDSGRK